MIVPQKKTCRSLVIFQEEKARSYLLSCLKVLHVKGIDRGIEFHPVDFIKSTIDKVILVNKKINPEKHFSCTDAKYHINILTLERPLPNFKFLCV